MKAQRIRIVEAGWSTYSDYFYGVKFENGLSVEPVTPQEATAIGSFIRIEAMDDGKQAGGAEQYKDLKTKKAEVTKTVEVNPADLVSTSTGTGRKRHTRAELEAIADQRGIAGIREIADQYGVKGRGIVELITEILAAQG